MAFGDNLKQRIHVKKGLLHSHLGIPQGQKIPLSTLMRLKNSGTPHEKKMAQFAINFGHAKGGS